MKQSVFFRVAISSDNKIVHCRGEIVEIKIEAKDEEDALRIVRQRLQFLLGDRDVQSN